MTRYANEHTMLHVRFAGRSFDVHLSTLDIGRLSDDGEIKRALAAHLEVPVGKFADYTIDRHSNGNMTLRPEAVFG